MGIFGNGGIDFGPEDMPGGDAYSLFGGGTDGPAPTPPKRAGFFKSNPGRFDFWDLLGAFGDAFGDGPPLYTQSLIRQRQARDEEEQYQRRRQDARDDWAWRRSQESSRFGPQQWQPFDGEESAEFSNLSSAGRRPTYGSGGLFGIRHLKPPVA
jgi:hypothetical protein